MSMDQKTGFDIGFRSLSIILVSDLRTHNKLHKENPKYNEKITNIIYNTLESSRTRKTPK